AAARRPPPDPLPRLRRDLRRRRALRAPVLRAPGVPVAHGRDRSAGRAGDRRGTGSGVHERAGPRRGQRHGRRGASPARVRAGRGRGHRARGGRGHRTRSPRRLRRLLRLRPAVPARGRPRGAGGRGLRRDDVRGGARLRRCPARGVRGRVRLCAPRRLDRLHHQGGLPRDHGRLRLLRPHPAAPRRGTAPGARPPALPAPARRPRRAAALHRDGRCQAL
ncbi:MAG: hypothetical protein AVDCRST_MAG53-973, partial [uncultured Solirubrobacteraceae bacterium]